MPQMVGSPDGTGVPGAFWAEGVRISGIGEPYAHRFIGAPYYYPAGVPFQAATNSTGVVDVLYSQPLYIPRGCGISSIVFVVQVVGGAGSVCRMGLYNSIGKQDPRPGSLIVDGGEFDTSAVGGAGNKETLVDLDLEPGLYWASFLNGVAVPTILAQTGIMANLLPWGLNPQGIGLGLIATTLRANVPYGALPAAHPAIDFTGANFAPILAVRINRWDDYGVRP